MEVGALECPMRVGGGNGDVADLGEQYRWLKASLTARFIDDWLARDIVGSTDIIGLASAQLQCAELSPQFFRQRLHIFVNLNHKAFPQLLTDLPIEEKQPWTRFISEPSSLRHE